MGSTAGAVSLMYRKKLSEQIRRKVIHLASGLPPWGWVPGFETNPDVPMSKIQNLLKPIEHLNFEIVAGFVLRISSNEHINKHLSKVIFVPVTSVTLHWPQ